MLRMLVADPALPTYVKITQSPTTWPVASAPGTHTPRASAFPMHTDGLTDVIRPLVVVLAGARSQALTQLNATASGTVEQIHR